VNGSGIVTAQRPAAGSPIDRGALCELWLERAPAAMASLAVP